MALLLLYIRVPPYYSVTRTAVGHTRVALCAPGLYARTSPTRSRYESILVSVIWPWIRVNPFRSRASSNNSGSQRASERWRHSGPSWRVGNSESLPIPAFSSLYTNAIHSSTEYGQVSPTFDPLTYHVNFTYKLKNEKMAPSILYARHILGTYYQAFICPHT